MENGKTTRIWYVSDLHGSIRSYAVLSLIAMEAVANGTYDAIVVGGDLCGNVLVPVLEDRAGWHVKIGGEKKTFATREDLQEQTRRWDEKGYYSYECNAGGLEQLADCEKARRILDDLALARFEEWIKALSAQIREIPKPLCQIILNSGTSDPLEINSAIDRAGGAGAILSAEGKTFVLPGGVEIVSTSLREPPRSGIYGRNWGRRKLSPGELREYIRNTVKGVQHMDRCVFNFHVPPIDTSLDVEHQQISPWSGEHTGSAEVRAAIEYYKPLAALHGYVHGATGSETIGRSVCLAPGSEFYNGRLPGVLLEISPEGKVEHHFTADPIEEDWFARDELLFRKVTAALIKNFTPAGRFVKAYEEIAKALQDGET